MDNQQRMHKKSGTKSEAAAAQLHHPWDEVSLPGAGDSEQATILQVFNPVNTDDELQLNTATTGTTNIVPIKEGSLEGHQLCETAHNNNNNNNNSNSKKKSTDVTDSAQQQPSIVEEKKAEEEDASRVRTNTESDNLVSSYRKEPSNNQPISPSKLSDRISNTSRTVADEANEVLGEAQRPDQQLANVLDIESHLIETYAEYSAQEESVGINELPPIKHELTQGPSKIETDSNLRTVIEVEPVGSKTLKPVQTVLQRQGPQNLADVHNAPESRNSEPTKSEGINLERVEDISEEIKATAQKLLHEIEQQALETLRVEIGKTKGASEAIAEEEVSPAPDTAKDITASSTEQTEESLLIVDTVAKLSQRVDEKIYEVTNILKAANVTVAANEVNGGDTARVAIVNPSQAKNNEEQIKILNGLPSPNTASEKEERKLFIDSLPQIPEVSDSNKLSADCKREYYQSLRKYLINHNPDKPPVPLQTYRWEDLRRARERGGYPWTHVYKRPLGADEEPELVLLLRKSQELRFGSESPKSLKKVHYDEQVLVKETERYIQELAEEEEEEAEENAAESSHPPIEVEESHSAHSGSISCLSDSVLAVGKPHKSRRIDKIRGFLKRRRSGRSSEDAQSLPGTSVNNSRHHSEENVSLQPHSQHNGYQNEHQLKKQRCFPIMKKLKSMADRQKKRMHIKRISLKKDEKIVLGEETKIMNLKSSPKSDRNEIPHFIEKQDSDDVLEIVELDESPSRKHRDDGRDERDKEPNTTTTTASVVRPDEIIEITKEFKVETEHENFAQTPEPTVSDILEEEIKSSSTTQAMPSVIDEQPPRKTPRLRREHVYEEIDQGDVAEEPINEILEMDSVAALKNSLIKQDNSVVKDVESVNKPIPLDRMGSSDEEQLTTAEANAKLTAGLLAPISSIDSASSDEDRGRSHLPPVTEEESDVTSVDGHKKELLSERITNIAEENETTNTTELKPSIKKEASPAPSDKKVTFSQIENEEEPHREDIELPDSVREATGKRWKNMSDHEYEPIGEPVTEEKAPVEKEASPAPPQTSAEHEEIKADKHEDIEQPPMDIENITVEMKEAEELQKDLEERYFVSENIPSELSPPTESRTDYEINTSNIDSSALEELPLKPENRRKSFMASAQDQTRKMQAGIKIQAGKIKTKLRSPTKKPPSESPKAKERRRFKAPEFSKMKMPELKRPDMSKLKDFKRPEFTKFSKPDMSKFKLSEKFTTLKLRRSKSFKENEEVHNDEMAGEAPEPKATTEATTQKKMFEFNFGTYPRAFRKKKKPSEPELSLDTGTGPSVIPSTETQPSLESSSSPQGDRGPGPVRSRWADKFSDVSYNDSEGSRYRRYGSEQESFDRESSLERRMREDLEEAPSEDTDLGILGGVTDNKQFAEFDEENRAIHEISNLRAGEFKRRPIVHQDSDLISEESKDAIGWTEKEIQKNKLLRKAELEAESSYLNYPSEDRNTQETQSTASSGKKVVMEEIDDDEFFLRKRGVSQDNIELRQYISTAIREGFDMPVNALEQVGQTSGPPEYGDYDVPPPKPRRLHKNYRAEDVSQEFETPRSEYGDDLSMSQTGSDFFGAPKRPMRKRRSRSKYSIDSQDVSLPDTHHHQQYFDDDEDYLRPPQIISKEEDMNISNLGRMKKEAEKDRIVDSKARPEAPRRRKRQQRETSMDKDSYINGFGGRSVSNSFLQPPEDVIVYRTEHEYHIPLATPENFTDGTSAASRKTRSTSKFEEDDRTSRGSESLGMEQTDDIQKFMTDMIENDGYAIVRKEHLPKPTPPARRKKFSRSPGERFATMPNMRTKRSSELPPARPPPPSGYSPLESLTARRKSALSLDESQNIEDDYEELQNLDHDRPESPRNLQSGDIINRMKYRPLPPPPRPPRDRRHRSVLGTESRHVDLNDEEESNFDDRDGGTERIANSSTADSYDHDGDFEWNDPRFVEVEVSTQTDPLPDDFVCEEFEITPDMKVIEPRKFAKTLEDILAEEQPESERRENLTEEEQLARGLQRFREANRRSLSEKSRTSSQADRSKSQSRPQTPSAVVIERRVSTPIPSRETTESMLEAALIVRPIDDLDLDMEEEALRREGLLTDSSQHSKSDVESYSQDEEQKLASDYSQEPSTADLEEALEGLRSQIESERETEDDKEVENTMRSPHSSNYAGAEEVKRKEMLLEIQQHPVQIEITPPPTYESDIQSEVKEDEVKEDYIEHSYEPKLTFHRVSEKEVGQKENEDIADEDAPQPPPRRRSSTTIEPPSLSIVEQQMTQEIAPQRSVVVEPTLTAHMAIADLEVDRLRVHALQAGKIMVSHLHGTQISSDDLECKSGNLVVKNIELPSGFIEDIVERVRNSERGHLHAAETQTSLRGSDEVLSKEQLLPSTAESVPPPKPPRQRVLEALSESAQPRYLEVNTTSESTQTLETMTSSPIPTTTNFPPVEYLQSLAPLAFYNLRNMETNVDISHRRRRHKRSRESSASEEDEVFADDVAQDEHVDERRRHRTRSSTRPVETQTVAQAGRQFLSACNLSLINIINQLTNSIWRETDKDQDTATRARQVPTLVALFIFITFGILLFLLSGKSIHHHHWDFFNPPGNNGRSS